MESNVKVVKSRGQLLLVTKDNKPLSIQQDMRVISPFQGNRNHVIVSVDFKIPLEDFCSEGYDDKGQLVATIKGSDIALALDRYKRMDGANIMKDPQFPEDRIG